MSSFSIALSGLTAASSDLDVTANNIANADTIGFKSSRAEFADLYASGAADLNQSITGEGVELEENAQQFTQGDITTTSSNLDLAISGNGFFTLQGPGGTVYTRDGEFQEDSNGNVVSATGDALQVYPPLVNGGFDTGTTADLNLQTAQSAPQASTTGAVILNLPANSTPPTGGAFNPADSTTYNQSTSTTVYDSLGNAYPATFYFAATANPNVWDVYTTINGVNVSANPTTTTLTFSATGTLTAPANGNLTFNYPVGGGNTPDGGDPMSIAFNFSNTTAYGGSFGVSSITQNGYSTGQLSTVSIDSAGIVSAVYTNGRSTQLGQLALANFANPQGLSQLGNNNWSSTYDSGTPTQGTAGTAGFGNIQSGALESSNVDLTTELVNMITAQRAFDANAQVVTTANQESQTVIGIDR
jgi:flagellar hook protein FlgE